MVCAGSAPAIGGEESPHLPLRHPHGGRRRRGRQVPLGDLMHHHDPLLPVSLHALPPPLPNRGRIRPPLP